jgi:hypothetical protein
MGEVAHLSAGAERATRLAEAAKDIVAFLNRVGVGNAEKFLQELKFADHQETLIKKLDQLLSRISDVLEKTKARVGRWVPDSLVSGIDRVQAGMKWLKDAAPQRLKDGIKEIDDFLHETQQYVRSGGETTSLPGPFSERLRGVRQARCPRACASAGGSRWSSRGPIWPGWPSFPAGGAGEESGLPPGDERGRHRRLDRQAPERLTIIDA